MKYIHILLLPLILIGILARFFLAYHSFGTNDVELWLRFASSINQDGIMNLYLKDQMFNHPPLGAYLVYLCYLLAENTNLSFSFCLKLPGLIAECLTALLIYKIWQKKSHLGSALIATTLFALSPISILINGYHGNIDGVYTFLTLLAFYLIACKRNFLSGGLSIALACNIKLIPVLLIPILFSSIKAKKELGFFITGLFVGFTPLITALISFGNIFINKVLLYSPPKEYWGIQLFLLLGSANQSEQIFNSLSDYYNQIARFIIIFSILILAIWNWKTNKLTTFEAGAISFALFAVFAPSFALQYFTLFVPLLLSFSFIWTIRISLLTGLAGLVSYASFMESWNTLHSFHNHTATKPLMFCLFLVWLGCVVFIIERLSTVISNNNNDNAE